MTRRTDEALRCLAMVTLVLLLVAGPIGAVVAGLLLPVLLLVLMIVVAVGTAVVAVATVCDAVSAWLLDL